MGVAGDKVPQGVGSGNESAIALHRPRSVHRRPSVEGPGREESAGPSGGQVSFDPASGHSLVEIRKRLG